MTVQTKPARESFVAAGNTFHVIDDGAATSGRTAIFECDLDPGWPGPPQHLHREQDETFYVLEGAVRVTSGEHTFVANAGDFVSIPCGDPHTFGNANSDAPARLLCTVSPASYIDYFRDL